MGIIEKISGLADGDLNEKVKYAKHQLSKRKKEKLNPKLVDVFCATFGEKYRDQLSFETNMDNIEEWDSLSFLDLIMAIEEAFGVEFTADESSQMFQLGHIQRILNQVQLDIPHDDVANACSQAHVIRSHFKDEHKIVIVSGSSTREALLQVTEAEPLLRAKCGNEYGWYNISVSGLVMAESLQLLETMGGDWKGGVVLGISPIILGGCGTAEFERAATHRRFPFYTPLSDRFLKENLHDVQMPEAQVRMTLDLWAKRYFRERNIQEMKYKQYVYPTLKPWKKDKFDSKDDFLRFYNNAVLNWEQSLDLNFRLLEQIYDWTVKFNKPLAFIDLTLHSSVLRHLESLGGAVTRFQAKLEEFLSKHDVPVLNISDAAEINDTDFRDPGHIYRKKEEYTAQFIDAVSGLIEQGKL